MNFKQIVTYKWFWPIFSILLGIVLAYPMFGVYFFSPNKHMFAFGGDALTLYYNVAYHTCWGHGDKLTSMNYPKGELIYLTDAQGALSVLLSYINNHFFEVCDYVVGIIHSLMIISYLTSIYIIYEIYLALNIKNWRASVFSVMTALTAPQIVRMTSHHGLSYAFLIPLCILWLIRKYNIRKVEKRDVGMLILLLFFGFNNPYVGFGACMFLGLTSLVFLFFNREKYKMAAYGFAIAALPIVTIFSYFKMNDPFTDRLKEQWGFYSFKSTFEGLLFPEGSLLDQLFRSVFGKGFSVPHESMANIGFPIAIVLLAFGLLKIFKPSAIKDFKVDAKIKYMLWASFIIFLYTSAIIFLPFPKDFVEEKLGFLLMFKAVARLSWPFWYVLVFTAIILIEQMLTSFSRSSYLYTIILTLGLWFIDFSIFTKPRFKDTSHSNFFSENNLATLSQILRSKNIDTENYQGIVLLPKLVAWSDVLISELNFHTQFVGMQTSLETGIPLISAMLSRISTGAVADIVEFTSHPLIEKSLQNSFPNKKDLLLVYGKGTATRFGEQHLINIADTLYDDANYTLLKLPLDRINKYSVLDSLKKGLVLEQNIPNDQYYYNGFNEKSSKESYIGVGALQTVPGEMKIAEFDVKNVVDSIYEFSAWTKITNETYHTGYWKISVQNNAGQEIRQEVLHNVNTNNIHNGWEQVNMQFKSVANTKFVVYFNCPKSKIIDEVLFRPLNKNIYFKSTGLYNGFKIK